MPSSRLLPTWSALLAAAAALPGQGAPADLRGMMPDEAVVALDVAAPAQALAELRRALGELPESLPLAVRGPLWVGVVAVWAAVQGNPEAWAERMAGGGAMLGWVPGPAGLQPFAVLRPAKMAAAREWLQRWQEKAAVLAVGDMLVVAADAELGQRVAARADAPAGRWTRVDFGAPAAVRGAIDLAAVRRLAGDKAARVATLDGPGRFLLAPLVHALEHGHWLRFALAGGDRLLLTAHADASVRTSPFGALLPAPAHDAFVPFPADGVLALRVDRSLRALLRTPEAFLPPEDVQAVRGFLSIADAIDGVRSSFVDDLLGGLGEPFALHVLPVQPAEVDAAPPRLQLPGFAVVAALRDPAAEEILFRAAQLFLIIANAERAQRGKSLFTARLHRSDAGRGLVAEPAAWRGPGSPPIEQALSPTLWSENGIVVLASTRAAAAATVAAARRDATARQGDHFVLHGPAVAEALAPSRAVLELARMLDEGEDRAAAARFFDVLTAVSASVRELSLHVTCGETATTLALAMERGR